MFFLKESKEASWEEIPVSPALIPPSNSKPCRELFVSEVHSDIAKRTRNVECELKASPGLLPIKCISISDLAQGKYAEECPNLKELLESTSDLVPGRYEGKPLNNYNSDIQIYNYNYLRILYWVYLLFIPFQVALKHGSVHLT
jgi:hypothetical protein